MIVDLAVILAAAAVSTLLFSRLRQPVVLGYLIAGFAVGPYFTLLPTVADTEGVKLWAEIGVIFLLFGLGLEFSFKKLAKVGKSAFISAFFEIVTMGGVGFLFGRILGWSTMDSIYLGAALSVSSTTIIVRAFGEAGLKGKAFVNLVFGILIVEDLIAILMMVVLSAISQPGSLSGTNLLMLSARLGFFLLIWFMVGIYVVPSALRRVRKHLSDEIMLIVSICLCLLMVVLATKAGFSAALGAFIMGSILAETEDGERIEHLIAPVKDLFAAVFFVSVGMLINPAIIQEHFGVVLAITFITIMGKLVGSGFGAMLSGRSLRDSVQAGMSLAQIGEFSFIIVTLGASLKVTSEFLYPIIIAVSAVTTFTTPYMIRHAAGFYDWMAPRLPRKFLDRLSNYESAMAPSGTEGPLALLWRFYGMAILLNSVVVLAISLGVAKFALPILLEFFPEQIIVVRFLACITTLAACSPFLFAVAIKSPRKLSAQDAITLIRLRRLQFGIFPLRLIVSLILIEVTINQFATTLLPLFVLIAAPALIWFFRKSIGSYYAAFETRFLENLNAKELAEVENLTRIPQLAPWNANLTQMVLSPDSRLAGQTLEESKFRSLTGATVAMIDRGSRRIFAPNRSDRLLPNDELYLIGVEEQLVAAEKLIAPDPALIDAPLKHDELYNLESLLLGNRSPYIRKPIRDIGLGEEFGGLIVGIERGRERILNPESSVVLEPGDLLWIFGRRDRIKDLKRSVDA